MAFSILLQRNNSENNHVTKDLTTIETLTGSLREESTIIDPIFIIEANFEDVSSVNYITVTEFGRSYFVRNMGLIRTGLIEVSCHVDVLSSFADEIKANKGVVRRQEKKEVFNLYLDDGSLHAYANPHVMHLPFPNSFDLYTSFIFAIAGGG